jgi:hypothetical protein
MNAFPPDFFLTACPDTKAISTIIGSRRLQPAPKESLGEDINQRRLKLRKLLKKLPK